MKKTNGKAIYTGSEMTMATTVVTAVFMILIFVSNAISFNAGASIVDGRQIVDTAKIVSKAKRAFYGPSQIDRLYLDMTRAGFNSSTEFLEGMNKDLAVEESFGTLEVSVDGKEYLSCQSYSDDFRMPSSAVEKEEYRQCQVLGKKLREELKSRQQKLAQR